MKKLIFPLLAALGVLLWALWPRPSPDAVATVAGRPILRADFDAALQAHVWRQGMTWETMNSEARAAARDEVQQQLVDAQIVRHFRLRDSAFDVIALTDDELQTWLKQIEDPAERAQRVAWQHLTEDTLAGRMREALLDQAWIEQKLAARVPPITGEEVRAWYDRHAETLHIPVAHHAAHIFLTRHEKKKPDRQREIQELYRRLTAGGENFAVLAAEFSEDERSKMTGGDLGWFTAERMPPDFIALVEKLRLGEISQPVQTKLGWHIIQLHERRPSRLPTFEEVRQEIEALLVSRQRTAAIQVLLEELRAITEVKLRVGS